MLCTLVPYRRTLCIADNMVVLNDKYMRDNIDMTCQTGIERKRIAGLCGCNE